MTRAMLQIFQDGIWVATYYKNSDGSPECLLSKFIEDLYAFVAEPCALDACKVADAVMVKLSGDHDSELSSVCDYVYELDFFDGSRNANPVKALSIKIVDIL